MPTVLEQAPSPVPPIGRIPITRRAAELMRDMGEIGGRYELIDGVIISKMGQKPAHAFVVTVIADLLARMIGMRRVRIQLPIRVASQDSEINEPEPDAAVLSRPAEAYATTTPGPPDILVVFEVADATLRFDLSVKARLYARAEIREYVVVDLSGRQLILHEEPGPEGYGRMTAFSADESFILHLKPDMPISVAELLPPD